MAEYFFEFYFKGANLDAIIKKISEKTGLVVSFSSETHGWRLLELQNSPLPFRFFDGNAHFTDSEIEKLQKMGVNDWCDYTYMIHIQFCCKEILHSYYHIALFHAIGDVMRETKSLVYNFCDRIGLCGVESLEAFRQITPYDREKYELGELNYKDAMGLKHFLEMDKILAKLRNLPYF